MAVSAREPIGDTSAPTANSERRGARGWRAIIETLVIIVIALAISALVRAFLLQAFYVPSASMESTLIPSDRIVASKITTKVSGLQRGEIMVFRDPGGWLPDAPMLESGWGHGLRSALTFIGLLPSDSGHDLVKRVIGLQGDRVACCDSAGRIVLNGVPLEESYVSGPTDQVRFDITVPKGNMFVMGDNRGNSRDSRYHLDVRSGGVPISGAVGRVILLVWPLDRLGVESIPSIFGNPAIT
ncbi:MAG: signal peptidase I, partial [Candidatus Nanopelagicales bacterium]